ncbi:MAG: DUF4390 domain-containing protein [Burkholderiales bacterium]
MMAFFTHCSRKYSRLLALFACTLLLVMGTGARAEGIEVRNAALVAGEEGYFLEADFEIALNPTLEDALNKGVPLYFLLEFEVIRPRWYWLSEKVLNNQQQYRLAYNALTRQYRLGLGSLFQNFVSLTEALDFLSRVRRRQVLEPGTLNKGSTYTAGVRMRLDVSQLPKPFQLNALASRDWNFGSDWYRWSVTP